MYPILLYGPEKSLNILFHLGAYYGNRGLAWGRVNEVEQSCFKSGVYWIKGLAP